MLNKINKKDLIFSDICEDSCTNTQLKLDDYDWMTYTLCTKFRTKEMGILYVTFEYCGFTDSFMNVEQTTPKNKQLSYSYVFSSELFKEYLIKFMTTHIESWDTNFAFNGEQIVVDFFNEVLDNGNLKI